MILFGGGDHPDAPIEPYDQAKPTGCEVIDLDGVRIRWGLVQCKTDTPKCAHENLVYSSEARRVWCHDCKGTIENFAAFMVLVSNFERMERAARLKTQKADEAMTATIQRRATKAIDKAWSSSLSAIGCPHCKNGLLPEDFANGPTLRMSREYEMARRRRG